MTRMLTHKCTVLATLLSTLSCSVMAHSLSDQEIRKALAIPDSAIVSEWSGVPDRTIVAYTSDPHPSLDQDGHVLADQEDIDLTILIIKSSDGSVVQRYFSQNEYTSDAMEFKGISLDLANYMIRPGVRAFGVRNNSSHNWCANQFQESIRLYEVVGNSLQPVLNDLTMVSSSSMCGCGGSEDLKRTIEIGKAKHEGNFDLIVREKKVTIEGENVGDECKEKKSRSHSQYVLRFDGSEYAHPDLY